MIYQVSDKVGAITYKDLIDRGLVNMKNSREKRINLCKSLNIVFSNGKTLLRNLNMTVS